MSCKQLRRLPLAAAALVACMSAQADYQSPDGNFRLSGFGTLGVVKSSTNDVLFNYPGQGGGAGTTPTTSPDSKLAAQATYKFTPTVSATTQLMMRYDAEGQYVPSFDWAFAKWQPLPALSLRAGRMGTPYFMVSDFRNVGYANTTVRPPLDVYGQVPTDQFEGADATYQYSLGSTTLNATLWGGNSKADFRSALTSTNPFTGTTAVPPASFELKNGKGINLTAEMDNGLTLRAGYSKSKISIQSTTGDRLTALAQAAVATGTSQGVNLAQQIAGAGNAIATTDKDVSFLAFGAIYDQDNWVISGEYTKRRSNGLISDTTGWYTNVGYRIGKLTPYVGLSRLTVNSANVYPATVTPLVSGNPALDIPLRTIAGVANGAVQATLNVEKIAQRTITVGSRWDVTSNVALKAQWDQIHKPADSLGLFLMKDSSSASTNSFVANRRTVNVLSVSMDFVF